MREPKVIRVKQGVKYVGFEKCYGFVFSLIHSHYGVNFKIDNTVRLSNENSDYYCCKVSSTIQTIDGESFIRLQDFKISESYTFNFEFRMTKDKLLFTDLLERTKSIENIILSMARFYCNSFYICYTTKLSTTDKARNKRIDIYLKVLYECFSELILVGKENLLEIKFLSNVR